MIVFVHVPKTAGTSFRFILENNFGIHHCHTMHTRLPVFRPADLRLAERIFPGLKSLAGHNLVNPTSLNIPDPFYITFLRDPIARVVSHYQDSVIRGGSQLSFEEALQQRGILENLAVKLFAGTRDLEKAKRFLQRCNLVGFTEKFELSLHLLRRLSPANLDLRYQRRRVATEDSVRKTVQQQPKLLELAKEYNELDLQLYAFAMKELLPRQCEQAGIDPERPLPPFETQRPGRLLTFHLGRLYNRIFRQICKWRKA